MSRESKDPKVKAQEVLDVATRKVDRLKKALATATATVSLARQQLGAAEAEQRYAAAHPALQPPPEPKFDQSTAE